MLIPEGGDEKKSHSKLENMYGCNVASHASDACKILQVMLARSYKHCLRCLREIANIASYYYAFITKLLLPFLKFCAAVIIAAPVWQLIVVFHGNM